MYVIGIKFNSDRPTKIILTIRQYGYSAYKLIFFNCDKLIMNNTNRIQEVSNFRLFLDEQLQHLQTLVGNLSSHIHDERQQAEEDKRIIENFVGASNSKMRAVDDYANKLREYVRPLHRYIVQIVDEIPPAIDLNLDTFGTDPLINALFVNSKDIDHLLKKNPDITAFLHTHNDPVVYALLTAEKSEKQTLGLAMQGDMLIRDVPQEVVNFSEYKIHKPCASSAELNAVLKEYLFNRVVTLLKQEMTALMYKQPVNTEKSYESMIKSLANPDVYLDTLIKHIENPTELLRINKIHFKLSKLGIKVENDDQQSVNEFDIHEIIWRNSIRRVVLQVKLPASALL